MMDWLKFKLYVWRMRRDFASIGLHRDEQIIGYLYYLGPRRRAFPDYVGRYFSQLERRALGRDTTILGRNEAVRRLISK